MDGLVSTRKRISLHNIKIIFHQMKKYFIKIIHILFSAVDFASDLILGIFSEWA